jgi:hypothetical protein
MGQKRPKCAATKQLFDQLVSECDQTGMDCEAESFGSFEIDRHRIARRRLNRQFRRLLAFQNADNVIGSSTELLDEVDAVRNQPALLRKANIGIDFGNPIARSEPGYES